MFSLVRILACKELQIWSMAPKSIYRELVDSTTEQDSTKSERNVIFFL